MGMTTSLVGGIAVAFLLAMVLRICLLSFRNNTKINPAYLLYVQEKGSLQGLIQDEEPEAYIIEDKTFVQDFSFKPSMLQKAILSKEFLGILLLYACSFSVIFLRMESWIDIIAHIVLIETLVTISLVDWQYELIPDSLHLFILGAAILSIWGSTGLSFADRFYGLVFGGGVMFLLALFGGMGGGDVKLMATAGLFLGFPQIVLATLIGFVVAAVFGVTLIALKKKTRKDRMAFGPYLAIGIGLVALFMQEIAAFLF